MENAFGRWHPLCFRPMPRAASWGGSLLAEFRPDNAGPAGVSWELTDASTVAAGPHEGRTLADLAAEFRTDLVGRRYQPERPFPIYVRLLDAGKRLPLLVHPDEGAAKSDPENRLNTKFWYCLSARDGADIMVGMGSRTTRQQFVQRIGSPGMRELLQTFPATPGDSYLIPAGRIHSAGPGALLWEVGHRSCEPLEIAAPEDADPAGLPMRAVHFEDRQVARICREMSPVVATRRIPLVHHCPYFVVDEIRLVDYLSDRTDGASFHFFTVIRGQMELVTDGGSASLPAGTSCLLPAAAGAYRCIAVGAPAAVLRVRLQNLK